MPKPKKKQRKPKPVGLPGMGKDGLPEAGKKGGLVSTSWSDISWTPKTAILITVFLVVPFITAIIISFAVGNHIIAYLFIGLGGMMGFMWWLLRMIENSDF